MQYRKDPLISRQVYHIYSRSIAGFVVFNNATDYSRMWQMIKLYQLKDFRYRFSKFLELDKMTQIEITNNLFNTSERLINVVACCLMPTHIHFTMEQISDNGISKFMSKILNSYARYFNRKYKRNGPLWAGRFKSELVKDDDQLLHLTRYIHLNPTSAKLVKNPEDWMYSSYCEYLGIDSQQNTVCVFDKFIEVVPEDYKKFVMDRKDYQAKLSAIKQLSIEDCTS
ncbi:hypothetical protein A2215_02055 [Candidatus Berkelbacteria bacterium RIFOXYA2_FULL_43_10]|uniref:Transposase IS200-like domain-containing protein n=1 Tax=Candidatus Berkelbacteria bacterium RIFOXYA2_FULL_43_10 TaxID=1797472 RepID=A0A1F5E8U5_9BACT|nr:MAG: hypothetical protein A2215_02055 [Candidatus Berkelbacteria bacterium RIFOXYA2_FULL_43_10]